jgi:hypothetical protein
MCSAIGLTLILAGTSIYLRPSQPTKAGMAIITMAGIIVTTTAIAGGITVAVGLVRRLTFSRRIVNKLTSDRQDTTLIAGFA